MLISAAFRTTFQFIEDLVVLMILLLMGWGRHWIITMPSRFENIFTSYVSEFSKPGDPDMGLIVEIQ